MCGMNGSSSSEMDFISYSEQSFNSMMNAENEYYEDEENEYEDTYTGDIDEKHVQSAHQSKRKHIRKKVEKKRPSKAEARESERLSSKEKHFSIQSNRASKRSIPLSYRESVEESSEFPSDKPSEGKIENHFIDVGSLTFGSIFGLGEKLEHRVIMARTTVQCLMIPRFWLLEKDQNPGNIWQRRRFYLDSTIPSRQTLFNDFLNTRQWQKFKTNLIQSNLNPNSISNPTHVEDIPIICRIVEASDE